MLIIYYSNNLLKFVFNCFLTNFFKLTIKIIIELIVITIDIFYHLILEK